MADVTRARATLRNLRISLRAIPELSDYTEIRCRVNPNTTDQQVRSYLDREVPGWEQHVTLSYGGVSTTRPSKGPAPVEAASRSDRPLPRSDSEPLLFGDVCPHVHALQAREHVGLAIAAELSVESLRRALLAVILDHPRLRWRFALQGQKAALEKSPPLTGNTICVGGSTTFQRPNTDAL